MAVEDQSHQPVAVCVLGWRRDLREIVRKVLQSAPPFWKSSEMKDTTLAGHTKHPPHGATAWCLEANESGVTRANRISAEVISSQSVAEVEVKRTKKVQRNEVKKKKSRHANYHRSCRAGGQEEEANSQRGMFQCRRRLVSKKSLMKVD